MPVTTYGKKDSRRGLHKEVLESAPEETTRLLQDSIRIADETENIGVKTVQEMQHQRQMIDETGKHLASMKDLARSAKISIRMIHEKIRRKVFLLWTVIIALFLANVAVIITLVHNRGRFFTYND